jgi:hypothetical protein
MISFQVPIKDLQEEHGIDDRYLKAKWLHYYHPTAGPWGGLITDVSCDDGIVSVTGEAWEAALRGAQTKAVSTNSERITESLMYQIDLNSNETGIKRGRIDTKSGNGLYGIDIRPTTDFFEEGQDLYNDLIPAVMSAWIDNVEWQYPELHAFGWGVDPLTRLFNFDTTYGFDRSATIALREGWHIVSGSGWTDDLEDIFNRVVMTGRFRPGPSSPITEHIVQADNATSIARFGPRGIAITDPMIYGGNVQQQQVANERVVALSKDRQRVTVMITDEEDIFARFRTGDIIHVDMPSNRRRGRMVVRMRHLDVNTNVMTVSGEAELKGV